MPLKGQKKDENEALTELLQYKVTKAEKAATLEAVAASDCRSISDFLRRRHFGKRIRAARTPLEHAAILHLAELGRQVKGGYENWNQMTKVLNAGGIPEPEGFRALGEQLSNTLYAIQHAIEKLTVDR